VYEDNGLLDCGVKEFTEITRTLYRNFPSIFKILVKFEVVTELCMKIIACWNLLK